MFAGHVHITPLPPTPFHELSLFDWLIPLLPAVLGILLLSRIPEPARQRFNATFVAGAGAAYLSGGLGLWEFAFTALATYVAYRGLESYTAIGVAWLMHSAWDLTHHMYGNPIIPFAPTSSIGCTICDAVLAVWFFAGAPSVWPRAARAATT